MARKSDVRYIQYYTGGSAAPQLEPVRPRRSKTELPKARPQQSYTIHVDPLALGGIVVSVVMLVLMIAGCLQLDAAREQLAVMEDYVQTLRGETQTLSEEYNSKIDLELVHDAALGLGMIPREQAKHITVVMEPPAEPEPDFWERLSGFMEGLFA